MRVVQFNEYGPPTVMQVATVEEPHTGPGQIRIGVRASGLTTGEVRVRSGALRAMVPVSLPYRTGFDAAGVVDEVGEGVAGVSIGDEVFGMTASATRGANADFAVLVAWAPRPAVWTWEEAGGAAGSVETATRVLDRLALGAEQTVLVQGAAGATGSVVVQFALARGATVIGTASEHNRQFLQSLGVVPTTYGPGLVERVRALAPSGVDAVIDCAGGALPDLVTIVGDAERVVTIADLDAAAYGVHLSHGAPNDAPTDGTGATTVPHADPLALHGLTTAVTLADKGLLRVPVAAAFPLDQVAEAHALSEGRHAPGRIILTNTARR
ncbi:NADP-dependent oxidoreductase [Sciscionella marina]|uniref:NADP-dependent oxidoreductase n=1 Tax=Sciscionella marina TaxID=508770 RepID=UPI000475AFA2|nr:NADP-dependent oxidoreductase [Sciscionella marina]